MIKTKVHTTIDDARTQAELQRDGCVPTGLIGLSGCLGLIVCTVAFIALLVKLFIWIVY